MNHSEVRGHLSEYLEGDLALRQRALIDAHLDGCGDCREALDDLRATLQLLHGLGDPTPDGRIASAVMQRLQAGEGRPTLASRLFDALEALTQPRVLRPVALAVVGAALLVATRPDGWVTLSRAIAPLRANGPAVAPSALAAAPRSPQLLGARSFEDDPALERASAADQTWRLRVNRPRAIDFHDDLAARHVPWIFRATPVLPDARAFRGAQIFEAALPAFGAPGPAFEPSARDLQSRVLDVTPVSTPPR